MTAIVAFGAVSGLGEGERAVSLGAVGEPPRVVLARDAELDAAGLARPFAARAPLDTRDAGDAGGEDRATVLLSRALDACLGALDAARPGWRAERVGVAVGTSSGPMRAAERFFRGAPMRARDVAYRAPLDVALARAGLTASPVALVLGACASSSIAIGLGSRWLDAGACDVVLAGGFDALSVFVAAGFEALRATTASAPRPFKKERDGMSLGEGAAVLALARAGERGRVGSPRALAYVAGFGASCDAVHVTAPDRTGQGLARAVDMVSAHATATPFNDAAESRALASALGARAEDVPVHALKAQLGHTLGAAGALEALACAHAMARGVLPATAGGGELDPDAPARLFAVNAAGAPGVGLKLASAFGGANAALVLAREPPARPPRRAPRPVYVTRAAHVASPPDARFERVPATTLGRADALVRLGLGALAALEARVGSLAGAGIVAGQTTCTLETNAAFHARLVERGARAVEPRRFPYTSPNAVCGECAVAFGLTGPAFAVGAAAHGALEALCAARTLVAAGDAERVVVLAVDDIGAAAARLIDGPPAETGAVAALVTADPTGALGRLDAGGVAFGRAAAAAPPGPDARATAGHRALLPLAAGEIRLPICLEAAGGDSFARIAVVAL